MKNNMLRCGLDTAFINGSVITVNEKDEIAEALGIAGNRIACVGAGRDIEQFVTENTRVIDLAGRTLMPGIIDTHFHPILTGLLGSHHDSGMIDTTRSQCGSLSEMLDMLREAAGRKKPGEWISMMGYEPELFSDERRHPTICELDAIAPENPVHCMHGGGHICMYNTLASHILTLTTRRCGKYLRMGRGRRRQAHLHGSGAHPLQIVGNGVATPRPSRPPRP